MNFSKIRPKYFILLTRGRANEIPGDLRYVGCKWEMAN
jgi:hypothetical protein